MNELTLARQVGEVVIYGLAGVGAYHLFRHLLWPGFLAYVARLQRIEADIEKEIEKATSGRGVLELFRGHERKGGT